MDVANSAEAYIDGFVSPHDPAQLATKFLVSNALEFYAAQRFEGVVSNGGDMLLFQYGVYDWGNGPHFEIDLTRQFIEAERDDDDDVLSQFRATFLYALTPELAAFGSIERWCEDLSELSIFADFVNNHPVLLAVDPLKRERVEIGWSAA